MAIGDSSDAESRPPIRVLIADDHQLVRAGFHSILEDQPDIVVIGEAIDGFDAVDLARRRTPDVVLMDIQMPGLDGLEAARRILSEPAGPPIAVLMLTTFDLNEYVYDALRAGASGFLLKDAEPAALLHAIRVVAAGDALLSPSVTRRVVEVFASGSAPDAPQSALLAELTERERQIVGLVAGGLSNADIAERLVISPATARTHVSRAMIKLGARDRAQLVVFAYESGIVAPGRPAA